MIAVVAADPVFDIRLLLKAPHSSMGATKVGIMSFRVISNGFSTWPQVADPGFPRLTGGGQLFIWPIFS